MCRGARPGRLGHPFPCPTPQPCLLPPLAPPQVPAFSPSSHCSDPLRLHSFPQGPELTQGPGRIARIPVGVPLEQIMRCSLPCLLLELSVGSIFVYRQLLEFPPCPIWEESSVLLCWRFDKQVRGKVGARLCLDSCLWLGCCWTPLPGRKTWCCKRAGLRSPQARV